MVDPIHEQQERDYLLTYIIGHNNPIKGFRPQHILPGASASCAPSPFGYTNRFGLSNEYKVVLFADFRRSPHQIPVSPEHPPPLHNVYVVEELIQLTIETNAEIIALDRRSYIGVFSRILSRLLPSIVPMPLRHKEAREG